MAPAPVIEVLKHYHSGFKFPLNGELKVTEDCGQLNLKTGDKLVRIKEAKNKAVDTRGFSYEDLSATVARFQKGSVIHYWFRPGNPALPVSTQMVFTRSL